MVKLFGGAVAAVLCGISTAAYGAETLSYITACSDNQCQRLAQNAAKQPISTNWVSATGSLTGTAAATAGSDYLKANASGIFATGSAPEQEAFLGASSEIYKVVTASADTTANLNIWAENYVGILDSFSAAARESVLRASRDAKYGSELEQGVSFYTTAASTLRLTVNGLDDPNFSTSLLIYNAIYYNGFAYQDGDGLITSSVSALNEYGHYTTYSGQLGESDVLYGNDNASSYSQNFVLPVEFRAGQTYHIALQLSCNVNTLSFSTEMDGINGDCDAGHSAYWNGLTDISAGQAFSLIGDDGQNMIYSSALSPQPLVQANVPEPASWAMLIVGMGAIGGAARRNRRLPSLMAG